MVYIAAPMSVGLQIVIACEDPARLAEFWGAALGYVTQPPPEGFATWEEFADALEIPPERRNDINAVVDPDGVGPRLLFERWEAGGPQQRLHFDMNVLGHGFAGSPKERQAGLDQERARLEGLGATFGRQATGMAGEVWIEMYDPEGNWFCVQ